MKIEKDNFLPHVGCSVEIKVNPGEILLIKGENGVGKSTLARLLFNTLPSVSIINQEESDIFYDRNLQQVKKLFIDSSQDILNQELFEKYWNLFGLNLKERRFMSSLSGGEAQMVKICLAAFFKRETIIFDEPSQNLDEKMKVILNELMRDLKQKALIIIEHDSSWLKEPSKVMSLIIRDNKLQGVG